MGLILSERMRSKASSPKSERLMQFKLNDPGPMLYHNEPIIMNGQVDIPQECMATAWDLQLEWVMLIVRISKKKSNKLISKLK